LGLLIGIYGLDILTFKCTLLSHSYIPGPSTGQIVDIPPNQEVECAGVGVDFPGELGIKGGKAKHILENNKISGGKVDMGKMIQ
jgi:hypothetical protein